MITVRRNIKISIVILIFIISVIAGITKSELLEFFSPMDFRVESDDAEHIFERANYIKKARITFFADDNIKTTEKIKQLIRQKGYTAIYSKTEENYHISVVESPDTLYDYNSIWFNKIKGLQEEHVRTIELPDYSYEFLEHVKNKETTKTKLLKLISQSNLPERIHSLNKQLEDVQAEIDSLKIKNRTRNLYINNYLMLIVVKENQRNDLDLLARLYQFIVTTIIMVIFLIIVFLILYLILVLILYLMKIMGVRTSRRSSGYYYSRPYRRRVKKIYKDSEKYKGETEKK